jgi:hypothetical protein
MTHYTLKKSLELFEGEVTIEAVPFQGLGRQTLISQEPARRLIYMIYCIFNPKGIDSLLVRLAGQLSGKNVEIRCGSM